MVISLAEAEFCVVKKNTRDNPKLIFELVMSTSELFALNFSL